MRFYIDYSADCGWALMNSHDLIEAADLEDAIARWPKLVKGAVAYKEQGPDACFPLPAFMAVWDRERILSHYQGYDFGKKREAAHRATPMYTKLPDWRKMCHFVAPEDVVEIPFKAEVERATHSIFGWLRRVMNRRLA